MFGYGSLVDPASLARTLGRDHWTPEDFPLARLEGYRRIWGVAMDNRVAIPGYKRFLIPGQETPPALYVAFLDIEWTGDDGLLGVLARVNQQELDRLVKRERNYDLVEVAADLLNGSCEEPIYTFVGSAAGRRRLAAGRVSGQAVVSRSYLTTVENAFRHRGARALVDYRKTTTPPAEAGLPVIDLIHHTVPDPYR